MIRALSCLVVCSIALLFARDAAAHAFDPALLQVRERGGGVFDVTWRAPSVPGGPWSPRFPAHCKMGDPAEAFVVDCGPAGLRGTNISVAGLDGSRADVFASVSLAGDERFSKVLRANDDVLSIPASPAAVERWSAVAGGYVRLGFVHIALGADHLLFVFALLLLVNKTRALVATITAFTVGHSVTLALATLHIVEAPSRLVEALIALSILLVATELVRPANAVPTWTRRFPWAIALAFGLLHGLGFASAMTSIGIPIEKLPFALLGFNAGVELGQLAFVLVALVPLRAFERWVTPRWPPGRLVAAYSIGAVAAAWTIDRVQLFWEVAS
jgi:hydrogenase/urease accessory protein HupE